MKTIADMPKTAVRLPDEPEGTITLAPWFDFRGAEPGIDTIQCRMLIEDMGNVVNIRKQA